MRLNAELYNGDATIVKQVPYGPGCWLLRLAVPLRGKVAAGQFAHVLCEPGAHTPLLRRPFSFWDVTYRKGVAHVDLLYTVVGRGTALLETKRPGQKVGFLGPVGKGFTLRRDKGVYVFVAGGVGIVPFYIFAKQVRAAGHKPRMILLFGARTKRALWGLDDFAKLGVEARPATDDGSRGHRGFVTDLLEPALREVDPKEVMLYTCGPDAMMRRVIAHAQKTGLPCEASLERRMGCALGACGACVTKVRDGNDWRYSRICYEGPTYPAADLILDE